MTFPTLQRCRNGTGVEREIWVGLEFSYEWEDLEIESVGFRLPVAGVQALLLLKGWGKLGSKSSFALDSVTQPAALH